MAPFSIFFSLYGLLLGLSVAVVVAGFARLIKARPRIWPGWPITLLGIFIMLDITSFWNGAWRAREWMVPEYGHLFLGMVVISIYYLAASMIFPDKAETAAGFDAHYFEKPAPDPARGRLLQPSSVRLAGRACHQRNAARLADYRARIVRADPDRRFHPRPAAQHSMPFRAHRHLSRPRRDQPDLAIIGRKEDG